MLDDSFFFLAPDGSKQYWVYYIGRESDCEPINGKDADSDLWPVVWIL